MRGRSTERPRAKQQFTALPFRVDRALEAEELTFGQAVLVKRLLYRCRRDEGETFFKLAELKGEMRWPWSVEQLRQDLHAISRVWFDLTAPDPPKKTWRVHPTGALLQMEAASALESTDNGLEFGARLDAA